MLQKRPHPLWQRAPCKRLQLDGAAIHAGFANRRCMQLAPAYVFAHRHLAAQRDAAAMQHEMNQRLELAALQRRLEQQAALPAGDVEELTRGVAAVGQCDGVGVHLRQRHAGNAGQRMVGPHDGNHRRDLAVLHRDVALGRAAVGQADVGIAVVHGQRHVRRRGHLELELHAGVVCAEQRDGAWKKFDSEARRAADADMPAAQALQSQDVGDHPFCLQCPAPGVCCQQLTSGAGHHAARAAFEQRHLEQCFQCGHLAAYG